MKSGVTQFCRVLTLGMLACSVFASDLTITLKPGKETYTLGESMEVNLETRSGRRGDAYLTDQLSEEESTTSGLRFRLTQIASGLDLPLKERASWSSGTLSIPPYGVVTSQYDLAELFPIKEAGDYLVQVRYVDYATYSEEKDGKEISTTWKLADLQSVPLTISVKPLDQQLIDRIERLLSSERGEDAIEAFSLLATAGVGVYRKELPSVWNAVRTRPQPVKNQALRLFLNRIDLADDRVSDDELFSELVIASTDPDPSLRIAVAESLYRMRGLVARRETFYRFIALKVEGWFARETSPTCRAFLVRSLPVPRLEVLTEIVQQDPAPQVRVAAINRLIDHNRRRFLELAEAFTNLTGEVTVEGRTVSFGAFVEGEKDRVRRANEIDDNRGSTPPPK